MTSFTAAAAVAAYQAGTLTAPANVSDTTAAVAANIDALQTLAALNKLSHITLTDSGIPILSITPTQLVNDAPVLNDITSNFTVDVLASATNVTLTGLSGHANTIVLAGPLSEYNTLPNASGSEVIVTDTGTGRTSVDQFKNVQALQFADQTLIVSAPPAANSVTTGNITEIYGAVFGREPDVAGLAFYQNYAAVNPNTPLIQYAEWFLASPEYVNNIAHNYAQTVAGDQQFITDSYQNLLGRTPSASETAFYENNVIAPMLAGLVPGTSAYASADAVSHAQTLVYFSASSEFLNDVQFSSQSAGTAKHWLLLNSPTYSFSHDSQVSITEGGTEIFALTATGVAANTTLYYSLSGVSAVEISSGQLTGTLTVNSNGTAALPVTLTNTAGEQLSGNLIATLSTMLGGPPIATASEPLTETATATYILSHDTQASITEGGTETFSLATSGVATGTTLFYALAGVTASEVVGGHLTGTVTVGTNGTASIPVALINTAGEGLTGNLTANISTASGGPTVATASEPLKETANAIYTLSHDSQASVTEGGTETFSLATSYVAANTQLYYTLSGVTASEVVGGSLTGTITVGSNGNASLPVVLTNTPGQNLTGNLTATISTTSGGHAVASASEPLTETVPTPVLSNIVSFNGTNGSGLQTALISDSAGDLFGETESGGSGGEGTVFEISKTSTGYSNTPITLFNFSANSPIGFSGGQQTGLVADTAGDLFGSTMNGGVNGDGTIFEILKTSTGYASTPIVLINFFQIPGNDTLGPINRQLAIDSEGNLFGQNNFSVLQLVKNDSGYSNALSVIFNSANSSVPVSAPFVVDTSGNVFGVSAGVVFEIKKNISGYAATVLANLNQQTGYAGDGPLLIDGSGNLFGVSETGGKNYSGTIFEVSKTSTGYSSTPTVIANISGDSLPFGSLSMDGGGDLFGTIGGSYVGGGLYGSVFEIAKTSAGYANTQTVLVSLSNVNGEGPNSGLIIDATGHIIGTTSSTVFEVTLPSTGAAHAELVGVSPQSHLALFR